jgi:hypothetical protein
MKTEYHKMRNRQGNLVYVHRYNAAKKLGRSLRNNEIVHHINGNKKDNRLSNLRVEPLKKHVSKHYNSGDYYTLTKKDQRKGALVTNRKLYGKK